MQVPFATLPTARSPCVPGQVEVDAAFLYPCVAANSWHRIGNGAAW